MLMGRHNARHSEVGADNSFPNGNLDSRRLHRRSTFPCGGEAAANGTGYTDPELGATDARRQTVSIEIPANETTTESRAVSPTAGASSQPNGAPDPSPSPQNSSCPCNFPWQHILPSTETQCPGTEHFKVRHLSRAEEHHLNKPLSDRCLDVMSHSRVFRGHRERLKSWPRFFPSTEASSLELSDGFVTLWSTFVIAESLLASVAIQPFVTNMSNLGGWQLEAYGALWMLSLIFDFMGLAVTAVFLGYLHASPGKLTYFWLCNIGAWIGVPAVLVLLATFVSLIATAYSSWVMYGKNVGIMCAIVEVLVVIFSIQASTALGNAEAAHTSDCGEVGSICATV